MKLARLGVPLAFAALVGLAAAACSGGGSSSPTAPTTPAASTPAPAGPTPLPAAALSDTSNLVGTWIGYESFNLAQVKIAMQGDQLVVSEWGDCHPAPGCEWGWESVPLSEVSSDSFKIVFNGSNYPKWPIGDVDTEQISLQTDGYLHIDEVYHFGPGNYSYGRPDQTTSNSLLIKCPNGAVVQNDALVCA